MTVNPFESPVYNLAISESQFLGMVSQQWVANYKARLKDAMAWYNNPLTEKVRDGEGRGVHYVRENLTGGTGEDGPVRTFERWTSTIWSPLVKKIEGEPYKIEALAKRISDIEEFEAWHGELAESLAKYWRTNTDRDLPWHYQFEFIDLYIKWLRTVKTYEPFAAAIFNFGHVALTSETRDVLVEIFGRRVIGKTKVGNIGPVEDYNVHQQLVRNFCYLYGGTPVIFDVFCREYA